MVVSFFQSHMLRMEVLSVMGAEAWSTSPSSYREVKAWNSDWKGPQPGINWGEQFLLMWGAESERAKPVLESEKGVQNWTLKEN